MTHPSSLPDKKVKIDEYADAIDVGGKGGKKPKK